jgi:hypothetical protein
MPRNRRQTLVLDCPYFSWRQRRRIENALQQEIAPARTPTVLPFTFNDITPEFSDDENRVVLRPLAGVKS